MIDRSLRFTIAVVDDDHRIRDSLQNLLESADYAVEVFASARAFLDSACAAHIDCLISDLGMPEMDGLELSRTVRVARPGLPIVFITGRGDLVGRPPKGGFGECALFTKPFDGEQLLTTLRDLL
jgi:FixJ family two-component response regulator